ncbi:hypothetical protein ACFL6C_03615 [Myxococcota bacterium]
MHLSFAKPSSIPALDPLAVPDVGEQAQLTGCDLPSLASTSI